MSNNKSSGGMGKGYYIAVCLCAAAIGVAGFLFYRGQDASELSVQNPTEDAAVIAEAEQDVAAVATKPHGTDPSVSPATTPTEVKRFRTAAPLEGQTVGTYAMETLSYNETTRDWRVHNGIDIAAEAGAPVLAAADGTVYTVFEDDSMGMTVVIRHEGGYTTQYSSLGKDLSVSAGDSVTLGQTIGTVGETALLETAVGPHVHFCVTYLDEPMDPAEFLALN